MASYRRFFTRSVSLGGSRSLLAWICLQIAPSLSIASVAFWASSLPPASSVAIGLGYFGGFPFISFLDYPFWLVRSIGPYFAFCPRGDVFGGFMGNLGGGMLRGCRGDMLDISRVACWWVRGWHYDGRMVVCGHQLLGNGGFQ